MNIHPVVVHFAIALLTLYAVAELIRFKKISVSAHWFYIKLFLLITGALGSLAALLSGDTAEHGIADRTLRPLIEMHSNFGGATVALFSIIALGYLIRWANRDIMSIRFNTFRAGKFWNFLTLVSDFLAKPPVAIILAFIGLALVTITGALGGAIVYGPDFDPAVSFIYHLLMK